MQKGLAAGRRPVEPPIGQDVRLLHLQTAASSFLFCMIQHFFELLSFSENVYRARTKRLATWALISSRSSASPINPSSL